MALFDLCLAQLKARDVKPDDVKKILESQQRNKNTSQFNSGEAVKGASKNARQFSAVKDDEVSKDKPGDDQEQALLNCDHFFVDLHNLFLDICELYVDILVDKDGQHSKLDEMSKQQLYFLTIEPDGFSDASGKLRLPSTSSITEEPKIEEQEEDKPEKHPLNHLNKRENKLMPPRNQRMTALVTSHSDSQTLHQLNLVGQTHPMYLKTQLKPGETLSSEGRINSVDTEDSNVFNKSNSLQEEDEEVFRVTTQAEMNTMMSEYRFRKRKRTLPSSSSGKDGPGVNTSGRKNPFLARPPSNINTSQPATDPDIIDQQNKSLMLDSSAQLTVWTELVLVFLHLSADLDDREFRVFLPLLFPGVKALTAYARNDELKQQIADFFQRVAMIFGFNPE